ncbi:hypothetical protein ACTMTF_15335 [Nonomuraea sp. ZG12]|uniref:hypothetical protein n=1 Tax=Nonomuraea sp. ZG12 TaxID=3452207 RepID=UPI003F8BB738
MKKALGTFLVSLPVILLFGVMTLVEGLLVTFIACAAVAGLTLLAIVGVLLLTGEL